MRILVQKFGGTSVATEAGRERVCARVIEAKNAGYDVVVVVSAMGRAGDPYATDTLISLLQKVSPRINQREQDMLISCGETISTALIAHTLTAQGYPAVAMTGGQAGILTDDNFGNARIIKINPKRILENLKAGKIVIVAGFQGVTESGEITTLGRGGSDTSATALGAALKAELVEIYSDVDGVMTVDPRLVPEAKILDVLTYEEVCEMAHQGAKVLHPRCVEIARDKLIPIKVKNTFSDAEGTLIADTSVNRVITGIAHLPRISQLMVEVEHAEHKAMAEMQVFKFLAEARISIDFISFSHDAIYLTVKDSDTEKAMETLKAQGFKVKVKRNCAKVSLIGTGMQDVPGVVSRVVGALYNAGIPILQTADSDITISCLVPLEDMEKAVRVLHDEFDLGKI